MTDSVWTEQRVERLKLLYNEGLPYSEIASELGDGLTREAISGKVSRLKLTRTTGRKRSPNGTRIKWRNKLTRIMFGLPDFRNLKAKPVEPQPVDKSVEPVPLYVPLDELLMHHCRWPVNVEGEPYLACGHPKDGPRVYCHFHSRMSGQRTNVR